MKYPGLATFRGRDRRVQHDSVDARGRAQSTQRACPTYAALHAWSVNEPEKFNRLLWDFCGVIAERQGDIVLPSTAIACRVRAGFRRRG